MAEDQKRSEAPLPEIPAEAYEAAYQAYSDWVERIFGEPAQPQRPPSNRAIVEAVWPLAYQAGREEAARDIEAAPDAVLPPSAVDRSRVAAIARGVAADGAEQMTVERAEARDRQEDQ